MSPLSGRPLDIFPRQPLSLLAKVRRRACELQDPPSGTSSDRMLMLQIRYACLDQEVITAVEDALSMAFRESKFGIFSRLLVATLAGSLRSKLSMQDFETIGLLRHIHLNSYEHYGWESVLDGLHPDSRAQITAWLTEWHAVRIFLR